MDYVVLDLEWNQASDSRDARNRLLTFEIIEIGAVKLNSRMEIVDTFEELIRPEKELVLIIVPLADRKTVMQQICDAIAQTTGEAGVIFSLPVDDVMGLHQ